MVLLDVAQAQLMGAGSAPISVMEYLLRTLIRKSVHKIDKNKTSIKKSHFFSAT